jgi:RNA polymerase sigma-70 factor, ECF subfamily
VVAKRRDVRRELSLDRISDSLERSSARLASGLTVELSSPSMGAQRREQSAWLADLLAQLPDDYRRVLVLRHLEELPFEEVGRRMNRSSGAVRMLWLRAIDQLRTLCSEEDLT